MERTSPQRQEVYYRGAVQGVGFRYTTVRIAQRHHVTGFVRNLADGRVHLVAEGTAEDLGRFLTDVEGEFAAYITAREAVTVAANGSFRDFGIGY